MRWCNSINMWRSDIDEFELEILCCDGECRGCEECEEIQANEVNRKLGWSDKE